MGLVSSPGFGLLGLIFGLGQGTAGRKTRVRPSGGGPSTFFKPDLSFYVCYFAFEIHNVALCTSTILSRFRIAGFLGILELRSSQLERLDCDVEL